MLPDHLKGLDENEIIINISPDYISKAMKITMNDTPKRYALKSLDCDDMYIIRLFYGLDNA